MSFLRGRSGACAILILQLNVIDGVDKYVRLGIWGASIRPEYPRLLKRQERKLITLI